MHDMMGFPPNQSSTTPPSKLDSPDDSERGRRLAAFDRFTQAMDRWRKANPYPGTVDDRRESLYDDSAE